MITVDAEPLVVTTLLFLGGRFGYIAVRLICGRWRGFVAIVFLTKQNSCFCLLEMNAL
jgi:hypothetical protein